MQNKKPPQKAWETIKNKPPAVRAGYTIRRKAGAKKAAAQVKGKQWQPEKVEYLKELREKATANTCVVCGDSRQFVLQIHHADPKKEIEVILCANCHDTVRRGTLDNLRDTHKGS